MKKRIYALNILLLFIVLICAGNYMYSKFNSNEIEESSNIGSKKLNDWAKPNIEYLDYYGLGAFDSNLPVLYIDTNNQRIQKETKIWANIAVMDQVNDGTMRNILDIPDYQFPISINLRGASSYSVFDKEQYRIKFYRNKGEMGAKNIEFLGMGSNSEWVLNGPFLDRTLLRNRFIYQISRDIFEWSPDSRFCEVFVNGDYKGVYLVVEPVTNGATRLQLSDFALLSGETAYIVKRDREDTENNPLNNYGKTAGKTSNELYISYPSENNITHMQLQWIESDISDFEKVLYSDEFDDPYNGYAKYIDLDNFIDYFILNEIVMNNDAGNLSTYIYKELRGKLKLAVWDFNNVYNNYQWFVQDYSKFFMQEVAWFHRLLLDRNFVDRIVKRYWELRYDLLSKENLYNKLEEGRLELGEAIDRNFAVWGYTFSENMLISPGIADRDPSNYDDAIERLKDAIDKRFIFLDEHISDLYKWCIN